MAGTSNYLALDLGAESGRGLIGRFDGERLRLEEVARFPNRPVRMLGTLHWDLPDLFGQIRQALAAAARTGLGLDGIGLDTWGVDFGLVGRGDTLLGHPVHYRDARTEGMLEAAFARMPREEIYRITGLQFMPINTLYQLLAMRLAGSPLLDVAETLLLMPDLLGFLLTGARAGERTNASTTQILDASTRGWSDAICSALDLPRAILPELIDPGTELGPLRADLAEATGLGTVPVIAPATHDTASAVAAVPAASTATPGGPPPDWCYISSGTWSLMGVEAPGPIITEATARSNFTNEGGLGGTSRVLKNIMGLWLVQECRRTWAEAGHELSYDELTDRAYSAKPFAALVDPDDPSFLTPGDMPARIAAYCGRTGQPAPADEGGFVRCALESLALKYRWVVDRLEEVTGSPIRTIHIVGGGIKNALLCQFTADACGRPVHAGPVEATAAGNVLVQALGRGRLGSPADIRAVVAGSFPATVYEPRDAAAWDEARGRFDALMTG